MRGGWPRMDGVGAYAAPPCTRRRFARAKGGDLLGGVLDVARVITRASFLYTKLRIFYAEA